MRGRIKEGRWVLIPGVIKNNTQWFWCQTISIHQSFFILKQYISIAIIIHEHKYSDPAVLVDTGYRSSAVQLIDRAVLVGRITLDNLVIVHDMFIKLAPRRQRGSCLKLAGLMYFFSCYRSHYFAV